MKNIWLFFERCTKKYKLKSFFGFYGIRTLILFCFIFTARFIIPFSFPIYAHVHLKAAGNYETGCIITNYIHMYT